jgi:hypothetical protein
MLKSFSNREYDTTFLGSINCPCSHRLFPVNVMWRGRYAFLLRDHMCSGSTMLGYKTFVALTILTPCQSCRRRRQVFLQMVGIQTYLALIILTVERTGVHRPYSQSITLVNASGVSDDGGPIYGEGMTAPPRPTEEPTATALSPWYIRALVHLTVYSALCAARIPEDFLPVHTRLQQEWAFNACFVSRFTMVSYLLADSLLAPSPRCVSLPPLVADRIS